MNPLSIMLNIVFSCIGIAYFIYGKKSERWNFIVFGGILCFLPYFFSNPWVEIPVEILFSILPFFVEF